MTWEKQNRFKSKVTWLAIAGAIWVLIDALGLSTKLGITNEAFNSVVSSIATILTVFGVLNNPTDSENF